MRDVVVAAKQVDIEVRLEMRRDVLPLLIEKILVAVERVESGVLFYLLRVLKQRKRIERIVVVKEDDVIALRPLDADIGVRRNPGVIDKIDNLDALVIELIESGGEPLVLRAGIQQQKLPITVELPLHRANHVPQEGQRRPKQGNDDAELRASAICVGVRIDGGQQLLTSQRSRTILVQASGAI